jgi:alpha-L-rhamnosidase
VYAKNLADFIQHSKVLGKEEGITVYEERLERLLARIHRAFYQPATAAYCNGTQVQQAFALLTGVCPPDLRGKVRENLFDDIQRRGYLDMGSSGLPVLLKYMIEQSGRSELLASPLSRTAMPSYGFFLERGQTTWPEHWQPRTSNIHTCYTGIASWFIKGIGGIRPDPAHPGFQKFLIQPVLADGLTHARASTESPYGTIVSEWRRKDDALHLEVEIPPNTSAIVQVPTSDPELFRKNVSGLDGVKFLRVEPKRAILQMDAGRYSLDAPFPVR